MDGWGRYVRTEGEERLEKMYREGSKRETKLISCKAETGWGSKYKEICWLIKEEVEKTCIADEWERIEDE